MIYVYNFVLCFLSISFVHFDDFKQFLSVILTVYVRAYTQSHTHAYMSPGE
jgi:hypothetical protein